MNILIVEDEGITALFLQEVIESFDHNVIGLFSESLTTKAFLKDNHVDLIFMDIKINGAIDGIQLSQYIYKKYPNILFIFLTAYRDTETIKEAQSVQPIGYLTKPIVEKNIEIILIMAEKHLKPLIPTDTNIHLGHYTYNTDTKTLYYYDNHIFLTNNESLCLHVLMKNTGTHTSKEHLTYAIWGDKECNASSLRELLHRLKKKLSTLDIHNIPNVGYTLVCTNTDIAPSLK